MKPLSQGSVEATTSGVEVTSPTVPTGSRVVCRLVNHGSTNAAFVNEPGLASSAGSGVYLAAAGGASGLLGSYDETQITGSGTNSVRVITEASTTNVGYTWYQLDAESIR